MSRACIPFHILFDKDLSKNELIIYGMIEHLESDGKAVFFNNRTIAEKLGISHESKNVQKMISRLTSKGYIKREHKEVNFKRKGNIVSEWKWCFNTVKSNLIHVENDNQGGVAEEPPLTGVAEQPPTTGVAEQPPYINPSSTPPLTTTTACGGGSFTPFEIQALDHKHSSDDRTPDEYLQNVHHHLENNIPKDKPKLMKQSMILSLLKKVHENGNRFESVGFVSQETKQETKKKQEQQKEHLLWSHYQNYLKSPVEIGLRERGIAQLETFEIWKSKNA